MAFDSGFSLALAVMPLIQIAARRAAVFTVNRVADCGNESRLMHGLTQRELHHVLPLYSSSAQPKLPEV
jgi:hypothetical protein